MINVLGADLSLANAGLVVMTKRKKILYQGNVKTKPIWGMQKRIMIIVERLINLGFEYNVKFVAIEGYSFGKFRRSEIIELAGHAKVMLYYANIPFEVIPPASLKKWLTGNGRAEKVEMIGTIEDMGYDTFGDDNQADALALALKAVDLISKKVG